MGNRFFVAAMVPMLYGSLEEADQAGVKIVQVTLSQIIHVYSSWELTTAQQERPLASRF